jgi:hypothetical protein
LSLGPWVVTLHLFFFFVSNKTDVATSLWGKCEDETQTPECGNLESSGTPATSELNCRGQNTSPRGVLYIVGKVSKCGCRKWPRMGHSNIFITSYSQNKGRESNWQFDSRPQKVRNRPNPRVCRRSATHRGKALEESYKFALDLVPIQGLNRELWPPKVLGVQTGTVPGIKAIWMRVRWSNADNTIWGKVVASPESGSWWVQWVSVARDLSQHQGCFQRWTNPLVVGFGCRTE